MNRKVLFSLLLTFVLYGTGLQAQDIQLRDGNLIVPNRDGGETRLTDQGRDSEPSISPDGRWIVFVRTYSERTGWAGPATELWVIHPDGTGLRRILQDGVSSGPNKLLGALKFPHFLSDSRRVVFHSAWAAVHGSIHVVDIDTSRIQYVSDGNSLDVVPAGKYKDHLVIKLHKYFLAGGTYDWFWLVSLRGKEVGPIGETDEQVSMFFEMYVDSADNRPPNPALQRSGPGFPPVGRTW